MIAPRILNLPADVRAALARVDGPGWLMSPERDGDRMWTAERGWHMERLPAVSTVFPSPTTAGARDVVECCVRRGWLWAFWPCNPAASVAAIFGGTLREAHYNLALAMDRYQTLDDHAAALSIIEAYAANRGPHV